MTFYMLIEKTDSLNISGVSVYRDLSTAKAVFRLRLSGYWESYLGKESKSALFRGKPYTDGSGRTYEQCLNDCIFIVPRKEVTFSYELVSVEEGEIFEF